MTPQSYQQKRIRLVSPESYFTSGGGIGTYLHAALAKGAGILAGMMTAAGEARPISRITLLGRRDPEVGRQSERGATLPRALSSNVEFDAETDRRYARANSAQRFQRVAHIFHQNWHGIRSAAGTLPGHKVALPLHRSLRHRDLIEIIERLHGWGIQKVVFHGFSFTAVRVLKALNGEGIACYLVWHGNLSQLVWKPEVEFFECALNACQRGRFRRAHMMKAGMGQVFPKSYEPMLLNSPPLTGQTRLVPAFAGKTAIALVPAYSDIRKNLHSSLVGAALSQSIDEVLYYSKVHGKVPAMARCKRIEYTGHAKHLKLLHDIDVTVNVTTIDCHPMVDLEALAAGAMAITGPLFLDALEKHPYTKLSQVDNPFNVKGISDRLDALKDIKSDELALIIGDYIEQLVSISQARYCEFLEL
jgi:hypothetical protein